MKLTTNVPISEIKYLPTLSYFIKPISKTRPIKQVSLADVYSLIKSDAFTSITNTLRSITDSKLARSFKEKHFDNVTFSGTFSLRSDTGLQGHSGLMAIDLDHVLDLIAMRDALLQDPYFETELLFISPSGDGLKWIIPIELGEMSHSDYYLAVSNYIHHTYGMKVDPTCKNVSRACFLPHDPEVYINPKYI